MPLQMLIQPVRRRGYSGGLRPADSRAADIMFAPEFAFELCRSRDLGRDFQRCALWLEHADQVDGTLSNRYRTTVVQ